MLYRRISCLTLLMFAFPLLSEEPKPATLEQVQKALEWSKGELKAKGPFNAGDKVEIAFELKNTSSDDFIRPAPKGSEKQWIGVRQAWIERLDKDPTIPNQGRAGRKGPAYAAGGYAIPWPEKIKGKEVVVKAQVTIDTKDFAPGKYRYTMEFNNESNKKSINSAIVEFEIAGNPKK